jgi:hypothetical protein
VVNVFVHRRLAPDHLGAAMAEEIDLVTERDAILGTRFLLPDRPHPTAANEPPADGLQQFGGHLGRHLAHRGLDESLPPLSVLKVVKRNSAVQDFGSLHEISRRREIDCRITLMPLEGAVTVQKRFANGKVRMLCKISAH